MSGARGTLEQDMHECSTLPERVEVKMASRVLKRLASTRPKQILLSIGGIIRVR